MTCENFYKDSLDAAIQRYENTWLSPLSRYTWNKPIPNSIEDMLAQREELNKLVEQLSKVFIQPLTFDATSEVKAKYDNLDKQSAAQREQLQQQAVNKKQQVIAEHDQKVRDAFEYNNSLIKPIHDKHQLLLDKQKDLDYVFKHYDITPLDIDISDDITMDEFNTLIDESIAVCDKYRSRNNAYIEKYLDLYKGNTNLGFTLSIAFITLLVLYFLTPFVSVFAFYLLFKNTHSMYKDIEKLRIAKALSAQLDYNRFIPEEEFHTVEDVDTSYIDEELTEELSNVADYTEEREDVMNHLTASQADIAKVCTDATTKVKQAYADSITQLKAALDTLQKSIDKYLAEYKPFPTVQSDSVVMSHDYVLGRLYDTIDLRRTLPCMNIVFDSSDYQAGINNMKLYLANALLSVRVKQLTVEIFDPKNMCKDFSEFFTPETKPYIKPNMLPLDKLIETYRKYSQQNVINLDNQSVDDYNKHAEDVGMVPKEYKLLLIVSDFEKQLDGDNANVFKEYFKFSATTGVMIWLLSTTKYAKSVYVDSSYSGQGQRLQYTRDLGKEAVATYVKALAGYKDKGIDYITKFGDVFIPREKWWTWDTIKGIDMHWGLENGDPTRGYPIAIGDANVHALLGGATGAGKSAAINQMLISLVTKYPPSELQLVYIDFKNVEAAKFTRGFDKLKNKWMEHEEEDKLVKAEAYYTRLSRIPHLRIISGTTDGEYALSVFEFLMDEMARRQKIINKAGKTKLQTVREEILSGYNKEHGTPNGTWADMRKDWDWYKPNVYDVYGDMPRLLVIFDEFQVMYNPEFVSNKIIDMINGKITAITKLARAMGAHFWFTSQSMKGTMSKDTMANFSLRGALRCTEEVSSELLGNKAASTIKAKFGYMYTNDSAGQQVEANKFWRVPFLAEDHKPEDKRPIRDMHDYINILNTMLEDHHETHNYAEFYDEKVLVPSDVLKEWYEKSDVFHEPYAMILGERASFSTNKAPVNFTMLQDGGENIMIGAFDRNDMMNLVLTIIDNLKLSDDPPILIMNCQDREVYELMGIEDIVSPDFLPLASPKQDIVEFIDAIDATVKGRIDRGGPYKPMFVICIQWEKAPGISTEVNYKLQDRFKEILGKAPSVGVHFVFANREKGEMLRFIPAACSHRITGLMPKDSIFFTDPSCTKVEKLPSADKNAGLFAIYDYGTTSHKFRIYQHKFTRQIQSREIIL